MSDVSSRFLCAAAASLLFLSNSACQMSGGMNSSSSRPQQLYDWYDDGSGPLSVRIHLGDQIAEIERGGRQVGWCYVATGKEGRATRPGRYYVMEKIVDKYSNRFGWIEDDLGNVVDDDASPGDPVPKGMKYVPAPMPYWMRLTSWGIGMHGGVIPEPGKPASHGCIRMPKPFAPLLFEAAKVGTPVTIVSGNSSRNQSAEPDGWDQNIPPDPWSGGPEASIKVAPVRKAPNPLPALSIEPDPVH